MMPLASEALLYWRVALTARSPYVNVDQRRSAAVHLVHLATFAVSPRIRCRARSDADAAFLAMASVNEAAAALLNGPADGGPW